MIITKTNFINYTRCNRYLYLNGNNLKTDITYEEYKNEELSNEAKELLNKDSSLDALNIMNKYYKQVEEEVYKYVLTKFDGDTVYSLDTLNQKCFSFYDKDNNIKYICYIDVYNKNKDTVNIIEVKATTKEKYTSLYYGERCDIKFPLFVKQDFIYKVCPCVSSNLKIKASYDKQIEKLLDRNSDVGRYIYDLSVQRYFIEKTKSNLKFNYYLAVLNNDYVYDGYKDEKGNCYHTVNGEDLVTLIKLNDITEMYQDIIKKEDDTLRFRLLNSNYDTTFKASFYCKLGDTLECPFKSICYKDIPDSNACYDYWNFRSFKDKNGNTLNKYDLVNLGYKTIGDVPKTYLKNKNHLIQRDCYDNNTIYIDKERIKAFLNNIKYPIYHLDFETFPSPLPRFYGERCYTQSCFEASLHIEREPSLCSKENDNYIFLATSLEDERLELVKFLVEHIKPDGTLMAQNVSFEMGRLYELANIFTDYKEKLLAIRDCGYDLLYILKNNAKIEKDLGFKESFCVNYYNNLQSGSYSIKKTLPLFTNMSYKDLEIKNGTEAYISYISYEDVSKEEKEVIRKNLKIYCSQDTYAMVEILRGLRKLVK